MSKEIGPMPDSMGKDNVRKQGLPNAEELVSALSAFNREAELTSFLVINLFML